ncbi:MAG: hypothetical protein JWN37_218 [Candidatus Nomurabacteria bacterium]|nr:hypothetical protein [Candidatus Nomurabacteria bacterium]
MKKITWFVVALIIIIGGIWAYQSKSNSTPIKIGVITALTGSGAGVYGEPLKNSINLALNEIDSKHVKYEVRFEDYQLDTKQALPAYLKLKSEGVKIFIIDGSPALSVLAPEVRKDGFLSFNSSSFIPAYKDGNPLTCRIAITADNYAPAYSDLLLNTLHKTKVVALIPNYEPGVAILTAFKEEFEKRGGQVVFESLYSKDGNDFRTEIQKIKSYNADAIIAVNYFTSAPTMFKQMKELGLTTQLITDDWTVGNAAVTDKTLLDGAYLVGYSFSTINPKTDKEKEFIQKFKNAYSTDPSVMAVQGYDLMNILNTAVQGTSSQDPATLAAYLTTKINNYQGVGGSITLNSDCEAKREVTVRKVDAGQLVDIR